MTPEEKAALEEALAAMNDEELASRRAELEALADEIITAKDTSRIAEAEAAADELDILKAEQTKRVEAQAADEAKLVELAERVTPPADETTEEESETEETDEATSETETTEESETEETEQAEEEQKKVPVAAASTTATRPTAKTIARHSRQAPPPAEDKETSKVVIVASANVSGARVQRGDEISQEQAWEMVDRRARQILRNPAGNDDFDYLGTIKREVPDERFLRSGDIDGNMEKVEALIASAKEQARADIDQMSRTGQLPDVLTAASAALCAPLTPIYTIVDHTSDATPFLDSLPSMQADRGGITFSRSPAPSTVSGGYTNMTAEEAGVPTNKNIVEVDCPTFVEVEVEAHVFRARYRNWADRFWPERTRNLANLGMAEKARNIEETLLTDLTNSGGVINQTGGDDYGAFRDFFNHLERAIVEIQHAQRLSDSEPLEFHGQRSLLNVLRDDLMAGTDDPALLGFTDQAIAQQFAARGVRPNFHWDGPTEPVIGADGAALPDLPTSFQWGLWVPGDVVALDGGELNFGVVRDSTLNQTNAFEAFFESFANVAVLGRFVQWITSALCSNGTKAALTTPRACPSGS